MQKLKLRAFTDYYISLTMSSFDNITVRKPRKGLNWSDNTIIDSSNILDNNSQLSLPIISSGDTSELVDLKNQIDSLHMMLAVANEEISTLSLEISDLKSANEEYKNKITLYKTVTASDVIRKKLYAVKTPSRMSCTPTYRNINHLCSMRTSCYQRSTTVCNILESLQLSKHTPDEKQVTSSLQNSPNDTIVLSSHTGCIINASTPKKTGEKKHNIRNNSGPID
jgi:hypothetical protein